MQGGFAQATPRQVKWWPAAVVLPIAERGAREPQRLSRGQSATTLPRGEILFHAVLEVFIFSLSPLKV